MFYIYENEFDFKFMLKGVPKKLGFPYFTCKNMVLNLL